MLQTLRKGLRSWLTVGLLFLLAVSFAIWGIQDYIGGGSPTAVARVDGREIKAEEFADVLRRQVERRAQQSGAPFTMQDAVSQGMDAGILQNMISDTALDVRADKLGVGLSDARLLKQIESIDAFRNPVSGAFDPALYQSVLRENNLTPARFERELRRETARAQLAAAIGAGGRLPDVIVEQLLLIRSERRYLSLAAISPGVIGAVPVPTEEQVKSFYDASGELYAIPELRAATFVLARPADFAARAVVSEQDIRKVFDQRKERLSRPESRTFRQLPVPDEATGRKALDLLKTGKSLDEAARTLNLDAPLLFTAAARTDIPDAAVAAAVFQAKAADALGPIQGKLGWSIAVLDAVVAPTPAVYEAEREKLRAELAENATKDMMLQAIENFEDKLSEGVAYDAAATAEGLEVVKVEPVVRSGVNIRGEPVAIYASDPKRLGALFEAALSEHSDMADDGQGGYWSVRVDQVTPKTKRALAEVRTDAAARWRFQEMTRRMEAAARDIEAKVKAGATFEAAAGAYRVRVVRPKAPVSRFAQPGPEIGQSVAMAAFAAGPGQFFTANAENGAFVLARIDRIERDDPKADPNLLQQARQAFSGELGAELVALYERAVVRVAKTTINQALADRAAGKAQDETP